MKKHLIFDIEIIGKDNPVFLVCTKVVETGLTRAYWLHKRGHMANLKKALLNPLYTWISFNGINFDAPLLCAALAGADALWLKDVANQIIEGQLRSWQTYREFQIEYIDFDHIDLIETAPGVMISLKTYAGRMGYPTMIDMPMAHDEDLKPSQHKVLEAYCLNDLGVTEELFKQLKNEIKLREELSAEHGIDLRSKSDAQIAEAILKKKLGITKLKKSAPMYVDFTVPEIIRTKHKQLLEIIDKLHNTQFLINPGNGSPEAAQWMEQPIAIGRGTYQLGIGGLHSTHDKSFHRQATDDLLISDFDVASYYPNLMMKCGLIPRMPGDLGIQFIEAYEEIYQQRMVAKHAGNKSVANCLKIVLNGTYGKLGSIYSVFYAPDVMLGVTLTGQLNLLILIAQLEAIKGVSVYSANTDGITVGYAPYARDKVLKVFATNSKGTGFEYEETPYSRIAMKDVNNYLAITQSRDAVVISNKGIAIIPPGSCKVKRKGLYGVGCVHSPESPTGKNPTMTVCSNMAIDYLKTGKFNVKRHTDIKDFLAVRNVKGGGVQHKKIELVDDWQEVEPGFWAYPGMTTKDVKRKSRPAPREVGTGGVPFGRVARWYMSTEQQPAITYLGSGNQVPKTEGAQLCMTLPQGLPADLDFDWYINETRSMLKDMGVTL